MTKSQKRQLHIPIGEFIEDIRTGMTDQGLMDKYGIAQHKTLLMALDRLAASGRVTREELYNRSSLINTQDIVEFLGNAKPVDEAK